MIELIFPDGSKRAFDEGASGRDVAASIAKSLEKRALLVRLDGQLLDLDRPLLGGGTFEILTRESPDALEVIAERALRRHTGARALRAVMDEIMIELMYHLPEMDNVNAIYTLDAKAIEERQPLTAMRRRARESA